MRRLFPWAAAWWPLSRSYPRRTSLRAAHLWVSGQVNGVLLATPQGQVLASRGTTACLQTSAAALRQFLGLFDLGAPPVERTGFSLPAGGAAETGMLHFAVVRSSLATLAACAPHRAEGLVVANLPHGVLVVRFAFPATLETAGPAIDRFCALLRA